MNDNRIKKSKIRLKATKKELFTWKDALFSLYLQSETQIRTQNQEL